MPDQATAPKNDPWMPPAPPDLAQAPRPDLTPVFEGIKASTEKEIESTNLLRDAQIKALSDERELNKQREASFEKQTKAIDDLKPPPAPILPPMPTQEGLTRENATQRILPLAFASAALVAGAVFSRHSLGPMLAASNAAAGAINGWRANEYESYERNFKTWEANTRLQLDQWSIQRDQYHESLELARTKANLSDNMFQARRDNAEHEIALLAGINGDDKMMTALRINGLETALKLQDYRDKVAENMQSIWERGVSFKAASEEISDYTHSKEFQNDSSAQRNWTIGHILNKKNEKPSDVFKNRMTELSEQAFSEWSLTPEAIGSTAQQKIQKHLEFLRGVSPSKQKDEDVKVAEEIFKKHLETADLDDTAALSEKWDEILRAVKSHRKSAPKKEKEEPKTTPAEAPGFWSSLFGTGKPKASGKPVETKSETPQASSIGFDAKDEHEETPRIHSSDPEADQKASQIHGPFIYIDDDDGSEHPLENP